MISRTQLNANRFEDAGSSEARVRSGEGLGSVVRELNNRRKEITQQAQQPQGAPAVDGESAPTGTNPDT